MKYVFATILLLVIAVARSGAAETTATVPFVQGRIVLLSGLPGDLESDTAYLRRLAGVLDFLTEQRVKPEHVHVLAHEPERVVVPEALTGMEVRAAAREPFLELGKSLGASAEPIRVIVWGHGGQVREEAVFHVAGRRITASDFRAFAEKAEQSGASTGWVLYFIGSGEVASGLVSANREILSSEHKVRFTSEPRGVDPFLKTWTEQPEAALEALVRRAGPRIAEWYTSRTQARTEEPVYFQGEKLPLLVAQLEPAAIPAPAEVLAGDGRKLPAEWAAIKPVDASAYPGAEAVVLSRRLRYTLGDTPAVQADIEEYTQILTSDGKGRGDFDIAFSPPQEDIEFEALEVLLPDGTLEVFDRENVLKNVGDAETEPGGQQRFSLPGVRPGAILHVHYRRVWRRFPFPHIFLEVPLADSVPILRSEVRVELPKSEVFHFRIANSPQQAPRVEETAYGRAYAWEWDAFAPHKQQVLSGPDGSPKLQLSTFPDWKSFVEWYQRLIRESDTITDEIRDRAAELTEGAETAEQKVKALYEYVTGMRYVAIPIGVNSYRPHSAASVLRNHYGDCKDKANLLNAMLRSVGYQADLVLVPRFSEADDKLPGLSFNHAISRVMLPSGPMWMDATDDVCPFGMLPPGDAGPNVLVIDGKTHALERLPEQDPSLHEARVEFEVGEEGGGETRLFAKGYPAYHFRAAARLSDESAGTMPLFSAADWEPANGVFITADQSHTPAGELDKDFEWRAQGRWAGLSVSGAKDREKLIFAPFVLPEEWRYALQTRTEPLFLNDGYPLTLRQVARLTAVDPGAALPPSVRSEGGPLRWRLAWKWEGAVILGELELVLAKPEVERGEVAALQREVSRLYEALAVPVRAE